METTINLPFFFTWSLLYILIELLSLFLSPSARNNSSISSPLYFLSVMTVNKIDNVTVNIEVCLCPRVCQPGTTLLGLQRHLWLMVWVTRFVCVTRVCCVCVYCFSSFGRNVLRWAALSVVYRPSRLSLGPAIHPSIPVAYERRSSIPAVPPVKASALWRAAAIVVWDKAFPVSGITQLECGHRPGHLGLLCRT